MGPKSQMVSSIFPIKTSEITVPRQDIMGIMSLWRAAAVDGRRLFCSMGRQPDGFALEGGYGYWFVHWVDACVWYNGSVQDGGRYGTKGEERMEDRERSLGRCLASVEDGMPRCSKTLKKLVIFGCWGKFCRSV